jgi:hypothetical protein
MRRSFRKAAFSRRAVGARAAASPTCARAPAGLGSRHRCGCVEGVHAADRRRCRARIPQSCGRENPDDPDFCSCGEYLRWEPTDFVQAITPAMAQKAAAEAAPPSPEPPAVPEAAVCSWPSATRTPA